VITISKLTYPDLSHRWNWSVYCSRNKNNWRVLSFHYDYFTCLYS